MTYNNSEFNNISQRVIYGILFHFSEFKVAENDVFETKKQKRLHNNLHSLLQNLYENPSLLELPVSLDESYPMFVCANEIPERNTIFMQVYKTLYSFYMFLYGTAVYGNLNRNTITIDRSLMKSKKIIYKSSFSTTLATIGIETNKEKDGITLIFSDLDEADEIHRFALLCNDKSRHLHDGCYEFGEGMFDFALCNYSCDYSYIPNRLDERYGNNLISDLFEKCFEKGYKYNMTKYFSNSGFWYDILIMRGVGGFKISLNMRKNCMIIFGTINGRGEKAILEKMDKLSPEMQEYFLNICRECSNCRGCIKGVVKNPLTVTIEQKGMKTKLCPMFPRHDWERPDSRLIELLFEYHELQEIYSK